jgi:hypothetical protein
MDTLVETKKTANDLLGTIQSHLEELAQATDEARKSKEMLRYLDFVSKFHKYSPANIWLILLAKPDASKVAGFHKWKSMGRFVRRGEQGLPILAPILVKQEDEDGLEKQILIGFKVVYVYDVTQTEGEPLPKPPDWKSPEKNLDLNERLIQYANRQGITVSFKTLPKEIQGVSKGGAIDIDLAAGTSTIVHEIAHEMLHKDKNNHQTRAIKELEAEAVSYAVARHFGLGNLHSPSYLALYKLTSGEIFTHMERIRNTAHKIITATDRYYDDV